VPRIYSLDFTLFFAILYTLVRTNALDENKIIWSSARETRIQDTTIERPGMNRPLRFPKTISITFFVSIVILFFSHIHSTKVHAFNNNNGRNLPFCDTTMTPSWDPPGVWYEWCGRRWFVPDNGGGGKLSRTFHVKKEKQEKLEKAYHATVTGQVQAFKRRQALKRAHKNPGIEITCQDMQKSYAFNNDFIEYTAFPKDITMDMGVEDPEFNAPQHWTVPSGLEFFSIERKILDPKTTPYSSKAPEATHCLYVKTPNKGYVMYQYFMLDEDGIWSVGDEIADMNYSDYTDEEIMTLPLNVDTDYYSGYGEEEDWTVDGDTTWYDDEDYGVDAWYYWSEGYGTLDTPDDGPIEVIKIAYQWIWSEWQVDEESEDGEDILIDFANGTEIYFYSKDGHQLLISMDSLGVETTGLVTPDVIYYQKVRKPGTLVADNQSSTTPKFTVYPNPTQGMVNFDSPTSFDVFDVLGRKIFSRENAIRANLSHLPRGMYFIRPEKGKVQKLMLKK
jgi:hypothetical protein